MKKWILIAATLLMLILLTLKLYDQDDQSLGDNYYYLPKYEAEDIGFPNGAVIYKANEKYKFNDIKIGNEVISVTSNAYHILAIQKNEDTHNDSTFNYYLIVKKTDSTYGPFMFKEYMRMRKELGVENDLILK
ncbi:hypothetical protein [Fulvivirga sp.]|uniref:hypothetical protein n=1 Tax=Fulvivirga sp. TaxID=1931237 RepID=UPI0032EFE7EB